MLPHDPCSATKPSRPARTRSAMARARSSLRSAWRSRPHQIRTSVASSSPSERPEATSPSLARSTLSPGGPAEGVADRPVDPVGVDRSRGDAFAPDPDPGRLGRRKLRAAIGQAREGAEAGGGGGGEAAGERPPVEPRGILNVDHRGSSPNGGPDGGLRGAGWRRATRFAAGSPSVAGSGEAGHRNPDLGSGSSTMVDGVARIRRAFKRAGRPSAGGRPGSSARRGRRCRRGSTGRRTRRAPAGRPRRA